MKFYLSVLILTLSIFTYRCNNEPDINLGKQLYSANCVSCHQTKNTDLFSKKWRGKLAHSYVSTVIVNGIDSLQMPSFKNELSDFEISSLTHFIISNIYDSTGYDMANNEKRKEFYSTEKIDFKLEKVLSGDNMPEGWIFKNPWSISFIDSINLLVTEKSGVLYHYNLNNNKIVKIKNLPSIDVSEHGGLLDVEVHPNFKQNKTIYLTYSVSGTILKTLRVSRFKLLNDSLELINTFLEVEPWSLAGQEFGSRMFFDDQLKLFVTVGNRVLYDECQDISTDVGKIHRFNDVGTIPSDNPFKDAKGEPTSIYTYGHRNPQGISINPVDGSIWSVEHGPKGGDELNLIIKGANYGWPLASYGTNYNGSKLTDSTQIKGTEQPVHYWVPSIAPGALEFVKGDKYPAWKGNALVTALQLKHISRLEIEKNKVVHEEKLLDVFARMRDIEQSPDGYIYFTCQIYQAPGEIYKILPVTIKQAPL